MDHDDKTQRELEAFLRYEEIYEQILNADILPRLKSWGSTAHRRWASDVLTTLK